MSKKKLKIFVAGHRGMVGSSIVRNLKKKKMLNCLQLTKAKLI